MSTATLEPIRDVLAFEREKRLHPAEYRDMALYAEIGDRAFTALDNVLDTAKAAS